VTEATRTGKLRAKDWIVRTTSHGEASAFIRQHHYSGGCPRSRVFCFGLFQEVLFTPIMGAAVWLPPAPPAARAAFPEGSELRVLCLSRLAIHPEVPPNAASFMLGRCIREIRKDGRWDCLLTFADTRLGHCGTIYRATNWEYLGETKPTECWLDPESGRQVSRKNGSHRKCRTYAEMLELGYTLAGYFPKHRFRMVLR
jgi:hypothetical protein